MGILRGSITSLVRATGVMRRKAQEAKARKASQVMFGANDDEVQGPPAGGGIRGNRRPQPRSIPEEPEEEEEVDEATQRERERAHAQLVRMGILKGSLKSIVRTRGLLVSSVEMSLSVPSSLANRDVPDVLSLAKQSRSAQFRSMSSISFVHTCPCNSSLVSSLTCCCQHDLTEQCTATVS